MDAVLPEVDGTRPVRSFFRMLRPYRWRLLLASLIFVIKDSPIWILPLITSWIIDIVVTHKPIAELWWCGLFALGLLLMNYPLNVVYVNLYSGVVRQFSADLRNLLTERLHALSLGYHARTSAAVVQSKVVRDAENIELMMQQAYGVGLSAVCVLLGALVLTAIQVPLFVLVFLVTVPIAVALMLALRRSSGRRNEELRRRIEVFSGRVGEMAALMPITRAHALEDVAAGRVAESVEEVREAALALDRLNGRFGSVTWISYQSLGVFCLLAAAFAALSGLLPVSAGQVVLLSGYFAILTGSVVNLLNLVPVITRARESMRSVAEVLQEPDLEQNEGKDAVDRVGGRLTLAGVHFRYPEAAADALDGLDLDILPGETVAIVGRSGSGKSTLLNVVLGFLRPTVGRVLLDGRDMAELDLRTVRRSVSVVPQESVLFEGSIRDNVGYGLVGVSDERIEQALRDANAWEIVEEQPDGWDAIIGQRGARLSGGQRQRLAIARALARDPRILLLDEATSALDSISEQKVKDALSTLMRDRTTLVVAHRLSTIRSADRIVVLERGRVVEVGAHDELVAAGGAYSRMNAIQQG